MKKLYHIITIGCQMNISDSERIASYLEDLGYEKTDKKQVADLVIFTTCGVRQTAEDRIYGLVPRLKKENPKVKVVLTGCLSERTDVRKRLKEWVDVWLPIRELSDLDERLGEEEIINSYKEYLSIKPKYKSKISAFVPIGNGCDNFCSYCVVPYARGREVYREKDEIVQEVKDLVREGYKEIVLIAQNVNSYRSELRIENKESRENEKQYIDFADLLRLINDIPKEFWIRFVTSHPKDMSDELIDAVASCEKVCKHIHLPFQAGNNDILKAMNRNYTKEHYKSLVDKIYKKIPECVISTDVIVGFPGETDEQFSDTVDLFEYVKFDMAYVARYSPRPGTLAMKLEDDVMPEEKERRENVLVKILRRTALENSKKFLDKSVKVLIEGKNKKGEFYGKTDSGKNVKCIGGSDEIIGKFVDVKIDYVEEFGIRGKIE